MRCPLMVFTVVALSAVCASAQNVVIEAFAGPQFSWLSGGRDGASDNPTPAATVSQQRAPITYSMGLLADLSLGKSWSLVPVLAFSHQVARYKVSEEDPGCYVPGGIYSVEMDWLIASVLYSEEFFSSREFKCRVMAGPSFNYRWSGSDNEFQLFKCATDTILSFRPVNDVLPRVVIALDVGIGAAYTFDSNLIASADVCYQYGIAGLGDGGAPGPLARGAKLSASKSNSIGLRLGLGYVFR